MKSVSDETQTIKEKCVI